MITLEIRRHAERAAGDGAGSSLTPAGLAMARSVRRETGAFALVVSSTKARARDTAAAIAGRVDESVDALSVSPDEALTQEQYDTMRSQGDVVQLLGAQKASLRFAQAQLALWEGIARRLQPGELALIVTHGGNVELPAALIARRLVTDIGPLPLGYCEGVEAEYDGGRWCRIDRLYADTPA